MRYGESERCGHRLSAPSINTWGIDDSEEEIEQNGGNLNAALDARHDAATREFLLAVQEEKSSRERHDAATRELQHLLRLSKSNRSTNVVDHTTTPFDSVEVPIRMRYERHGFRPSTPPPINTSLHHIDDSGEEIVEGEDALHEHRQSPLPDSFLAHLLSLSLETTEKEKLLREKASRTGSGVSKQQQMKPSSRRRLVVWKQGTYPTKINPRTKSPECPSLYDDPVLGEILESRYRTRSLQMEEEQAEKEASLPLESDMDEANAVNILVRMPSGNRLGCRFMKYHNLQTVFDFIDTSRLIRPNSYRLVKSFPRQTFGVEQSCLTLQELGLVNKQEALFLEMI